MKRISVLIVLFVMCVNAYSQESELEKSNVTEDVFYGEKIEEKGVISSTAILGEYQKMKITDTIKVKFSAVITDVCKAKGCWMKLSLGNNEEAMVRFKEYGFFVPKDIEGKEVVVSGLAFVEEMSIADQQHYAKDVGKTEEEIAEITKTKKTYGFTAAGVLLKK